MFSWKPEAVTPTAVLPFRIWWACVLFNRVISGFSQSCEMTPLHPTGHTTLHQPAQKWSATTSQACSWCAGSCGPGSTCGSRWQEVAGLGWPWWHQRLPRGTKTTQTARTQVLHLRSFVDHVPHRCLKRQPVHGLAITNPQSSPFLTPACLKSPLHQVSRLPNLIDVEAEQDRCTKTPKSHQVKYPMVLPLHSWTRNICQPSWLPSKAISPA